MCGRYYTDLEDEQMQRIYNLINSDALKILKTGEIFPSDFVPIVVYDNKQIKVSPAKWGFSNDWKPREIINAKSETIFDKITFKKAIETRRCVIPCNGFYEWHTNELGVKYKYLFKSKEVFYLAGIYRIKNEMIEFVIITKEANELMSNYHTRMPICLNKKDIKLWLSNNSLVKDYFKSDLVPLEVEKV